MAVVLRAFAGHRCCCWERPAMLDCQRANDALANSSSGLMGAFAFRRLARETTRKPMTRMMNSTGARNVEHVSSKNINGEDLRLPIAIPMLVVMVRSPAFSPPLSDESPDRSKMVLLVAKLLKSRVGAMLTGVGRRNGCMRYMGGFAGALRGGDGCF